MYGVCVSVCVSVRCRVVCVCVCFNILYNLAYLNISESVPTTISAPSTYTIYSIECISAVYIIIFMCCSFNHLTTCSLLLLLLFLFLFLFVLVVVALIAVAIVF